MSSAEFLDLHSMENLAHTWREEWDEHLRIITHRFYYMPGLSLPENGISTLIASAEQGYRIHEFDVVATQDGHVVDHDFSPRRAADIEGAYVDLAQEDVIGHRILIRQFTHENFATSSTPSNDTIMPAGKLLTQARAVVPTGTFLADCRDNDVGSFAAWISRRPECSYTSLMFYTFTIITGEGLVAEIEKHDPHPYWRDTVTLICNLYPSELITLARRYNMPVRNVSDLVAAGKKYLTSLKDARVPLVALLTMCSGIEREDVVDLENEEVRCAVDAEYAIVELVSWARSCRGFKGLKFGSGTRSYDVSIPQSDGHREYFTYDLKTGNLNPWPVLRGLRRIKELYSTPGQPEKVLRPNFICTDEPEKANFFCCGVAADTSLGFRHPRFDTVAQDE